MPDRLALLRRAMRTHKLDAFLVSSLSNLRYLTGFSGSNGAGLVTANQLFLITDKRYREQLQHEVTGAEPLIADKTLFDPIKNGKLLQQCKRIGFEAAHLTFRAFSMLRDAAPSSEPVATENLLERITAVKLPEEITRIRKACAIAAQVWPQVLRQIRPGMSELEVAAELSYLGRKAGAENDAFAPIVASGWRSALPHGLASSKRLQANELVVIDFGFRYEGFNSDVTRTIAIGAADAEQRRIYDAVLLTQARAIAAIQPKMKAASLDEIARSHLRELGFDSEFSHSLGHGLGYDVHSLPRVGERSKDTLFPGCVITIEPGVYRSNTGGVRIEDDVLVTLDGAEVLTQIPRELVIIE